MIRRLNELGFTTVYHLTPLHHLPLILVTEQLLSKQELRRRELNIRPRPTSIQKDVALGFTNYIHNFLLRSTHNNNRQAGKIIPILNDKLSKGYPHVCLKIPLSFFDKPVMCWWNIGKGHPNGSCANWSATVHVDFWIREQRFERNENDSLKYRKGFFNEPMIVPTIIDLYQLNFLISVVGGKIKGRSLELLQEGSLALYPRENQNIAVEFYSERDMDLAMTCLPNKILEKYPFLLINPQKNGYKYNHQNNQTWRKTHDYFTGRQWDQSPIVTYD